MPSSFQSLDNQCYKTKFSQQRFIQKDIHVAIRTSQGVFRTQRRSRGGTGTSNFQSNRSHRAKVARYVSDSIGIGEYISAKRKGLAGVLQRATQQAVHVTIHARAGRRMHPGPQVRQLAI